jgi:Flp pilus assembly protein TadG
MRGMRGNLRGVGHAREEHGAAAVEFALVLPLLLVLLLGIIDFGLYFYNDLQLTHVARDAARYLSVDDADAANAAIDNATLISTTIDSRLVEGAATQGGESTITLEATYTCLTPLPQLVGIGPDVGIDASVIMRRE